MDRLDTNGMRIWHIASACLLLAALGCANGGGRIGLIPNEPPGMADFNRVYNWNLGQHIVTKIGNVLTGVVGLPPYILIEAPINAAVYGELKSAYTLKWFGSLGGLLIGSLSLPITLWFPRDDRPSFLEWYPPIRDLPPEDLAPP